MDSQKSTIITSLLILALLFFSLDVYYHSYDYFYHINLGSRLFEERVPYLSKQLLFKNNYITKLTVVILIAIATFISKPKGKLTKENSSKNKELIKTIAFGSTYLLSSNILLITGYTTTGFHIQFLLNITSLLLFITAILTYNKYIHSDLLKDRFNKEAKRFPQQVELMENQYSVNIKTEDGWINNINPFRASMVLGTPGSGKSYSVINEAIIQHIKKEFTLLLYDFKFPTQATLVYNALQKHLDAYTKKPQFCVIDFDNPRNRCNPLQPDLLIDTTDATAAAQALMFGLYPKWAQKQGEFFTESSINFVAACIWGLKHIENGKYCTVPHLIQFTTLDYDYLFSILSDLNDPYINNVIAPFLSAWKAEATDQLEGQIGTTRIALSRLTSKTIYYVMNPKENDPTNFSLQINDPNNPIILILGNNPDKKDVYAPLLSLYNTRVMRLINKPKMQKTAIFLDELPTLSFPPGSLDTLIGTARSNKIAVWLGFQDFTQLTRDMGKETGDVIKNTVGNIYSGMVNFATAKELSETFGKIKVQKESVNLSKSDTSVNYSTQMEDMIPPSEISALPQGYMVGRISDDRGQEIEQKTFYSKILIDVKQRNAYEKEELPAFPNPDNLNEIIEENFQQIAQDIQELAESYSQIIEEPKEIPTQAPSIDQIGLN